MGNHRIAKTYGIHTQIIFTRIFLYVMFLISFERLQEFIAPLWCVKVEFGDSKLRFPSFSEAISMALLPPQSMCMFYLAKQSDKQRKFEDWLSLKFLLCELYSSLPVRALLVAVISSPEE